MRLSSEEKNRELEKYLKLVHATFDYLTIKFGQRMVIDEVASGEVMYSNQKVRAETYFKERRLDKLKKQFKAETNWLMITFDLDFNDYIKKNTAYEFDLFEDVKNGAEEVLKKGIIENEIDSRHVGLMINLYEKTVPDNEKISTLQSLQRNFYDTRGMPPKRKNQYEEYSQTVEYVEEDGIMLEVTHATFTVFEGPKPKHHKENKEMAPDGNRWFTLTERTIGKQSSTTLTIHFSEMSVQVYNAEGIHSDINAYWKDNTTIVIATKKEYISFGNYKKVESYGDVVFIEYIEN